MARQQYRLCLSWRFCGCGVISTDLSAAGCYLSIVAVVISVLESHAYVFGGVYESVAQAFLLRPLYSSLEQGFKSKHDLNVGLILSHFKKIAI